MYTDFAHSTKGGISIEALRRRWRGLRELAREYHQVALVHQENAEREGRVLSTTYVETVTQNLGRLDVAMATIEAQAKSGDLTKVPVIVIAPGHYLCTEPEVLRGSHTSCIHRGCAACFHQETYVDDLPPDHCRMCRGTGTRPEFHHVQEGVCFHCGGSGRHALPTSTGADPHVS